MQAGTAGRAPLTELMYASSSACCTPCAARWACSVCTAPICPRTTHHLPACLLQQSVALLRQCAQTFVQRQHRRARTTQCVRCEVECQLTPP